MRYSRFIFFAALAFFIAVLIYSYRVWTMTPHSGAINGQSASVSASLSPAEQEARAVSFVSDLQLMQAHLLIGKELLEQGTPGQAEPHLAYSVNQSYPDVEGQLKERKAPDDMLSTLTKLYETSRFAPSSTVIEADYALVVQQLNEAVATVPNQVRSSPEFVLGVINNILSVADADYEKSVDNDKIVEVVEYQNARGFVMLSQQLYEPIAGQLKQTNPKVASVIAEHLAQLMMVWPSVNPPESVVMSPEEVSKLVESIRENGETLE
jgi:hypothetical protein